MSRRGPAHCTGDARSLNTGSVITFRPPTWSSTVECPSHVAVNSSAAARGYTTAGVAVGNEPGDGVGARFWPRRCSAQRRTLPSECGSLLGHGFWNRLRTPVSCRGGPRDASARDGLLMTTAQLLMTTERPREQVFPTLTPAQIERAAQYGVRRMVAKDEILLDAGSPPPGAFVVVKGALDVFRTTRDGFALLAQHGPGQFTGEAGLLVGRRAMARIQAKEPGEVIEIDRVRLKRLLQVESEVGEIVMRAFILRRAELIGHGYGDTVLVGSTHCS